MKRLRVALLLACVAPEAPAQVQVVGIEGDRSLVEVERLGDTRKTKIYRRLKLEPGDLIRTNDGSAEGLSLRLRCPLGTDHSYKLEGPFQILVDVPTVRVSDPPQGDSPDWVPPEFVRERSGETRRIWDKGEALDETLRCHVAVAWGGEYDLIEDPALPVVLGPFQMAGHANEMVSPSARVRRALYSYREFGESRYTRSDALTALLAYEPWEMDAAEVAAARCLAISRAKSCLEGLPARLRIQDREE